MKVSIVIICWNDLKCILDCIESVYAQTSSILFEVIMTDNGSTDGSVEAVRKKFPQARIVENRANIGFGAGNNAGFAVAQGEYVFILNPDTVILDRAVEKLVAFADARPKAGAFGCRTLNPDRSLQPTTQPTPSVFRYLIGALYLRWLGRVSDAFQSDGYFGWDGKSEREIGFQAGCSLLVRGPLLKKLGGFDTRFIHQFEDADLCRRVWESGSRVVYCPDAEIIHIGGQRRGTYPAEVVLKTERSKYRYFYKYNGDAGASRIRVVSLIGLGLRWAGYAARGLFKSDALLKKKVELYRALLKWHWRINPVDFVVRGIEPKLGEKSEVTEFAGGRP